jgi:hypothetical protein
MARKENFLPIDIEVCHEIQVECLTIEGTMNRDFGPWKANDAKTLTFNFEKGVCQEHNDLGEIVEEVDISITTERAERAK